MTPLRGVTSSARSVVEPHCGVAAAVLDPRLDNAADHSVEVGFVLDQKRGEAA